MALNRYGQTTPSIPKEMAIKLEIDIYDIGTRYKLRVKTQRGISDYTGEVIAKDERQIKIRDKYGKGIIINRDDVLTPATEISDRDSDD